MVAASALATSWRSGQHEVLEVNDQEVILRCMPHQRGVLLVLRDDDGYSHGDRVPENGLKLPARFNPEHRHERRLVFLVEREDVEDRV